MTTSMDAQAKDKTIRSRIIPVLIIAAALAAFFGLGLDEYFSMSVLQENHAALKGFAADYGILAILMFVLVYAGAVSISFPGASLLTIFGGFMFGAAVGGLAVVFGATIGATIIFLLARTVLGDSLRDRAGPSLQKFEAGFRDGELSYMFVLRLVPLFPFWLVNLAPAFLGVSTRNFVIATFFGIIPATFVYATAGAVGSEAIERGEDLNLSGLLLEPKVMFLIGGLIVLALIPVLYKKFKSKPDLDVSKDS